jgi:hypothetical protein
MSEDLKKCPVCYEIKMWTAVHPNGDEVDWCVLIVWRRLDSLPGTMQRRKELVLNACLMIQWSHSGGCIWSMTKRRHFQKLYCHYELGELPCEDCIHGHLTNFDSPCCECHHAKSCNHEAQPPAETEE